MQLGFTRSPIGLRDTRGLVSRHIRTWLGRHPGAQPGTSVLVVGVHGAPGQSHSRRSRVLAAVRRCRGSAFHRSKRQLRASSPVGRRMLRTRCMVPERGMDVDPISGIENACDPQHRDLQTKLSYLPFALRFHGPRWSIELAALKSSRSRSAEHLGACPSNGFVREEQH